MVKAHGLRGAVKVHLHNVDSEALAASERVILAVAGEERSLQSRFLGEAGGLAILELEGVKDRDAADALRGARVLVDREALSPLAEDEYFYVDLIGCRVEDEAGSALGTVAEVFSAGASDVLVVRDGHEERMIPLVDEWVVAVDLEARCIRVRGAEQWEPTRA